MDGNALITLPVAVRAKISIDALRDDNSFMNIGIFTTTFFPQTGGAERFVHGLGTYMAEQHHDVTVIAPLAEELDTGSFAYTVFPLRWLGVFSSSSLFFRWVLLANLIRAHLKHRFTLIQVVGLYPAGLAAAIFTWLFPRTPVLIRATGSDIQVLPEINYGLRLDPKIDKRIRWTIQQVDRLVANSISVKHDFFDLDCPTDKVVVIPNALDNERFHLTERQKRDIRKQYTGNMHARIILSVGRVSEERKNYPLLLRAVKRLVDAGMDDVFCVLVGPGEEAVRPLIHELGIEKRVILTGRLPKDGTTDYAVYPPQEVIDLYMASTVFALPSRMEGQPNVLLEALAAGLPIVANKVPGSKDVVQGGFNGMLVDPTDEEAFGTALQQILATRDVQYLMRAEALKAAQHYSWQVVGEQYHDVYRMLEEHYA